MAEENKHPTTESEAVALHRSCSVTYLKCEHWGWFSSAVAGIPLVALTCAIASDDWKGGYLAGISTGILWMTWHVVLWAKLTRRQSPND